MSANFNVPGGYKNFRFWCQKALPLVYDDALSYYELLCKVVDYLNKLLDGQNQTAEAFDALQNYVNNYFDSQDFAALINAKLDEMAEDGTLDDIINQNIFNDLNDDITALDARMDTAESNIAALQAAVADLRARKWLIMGDSYAQGYTSDGNVTGFPTLVKNQLGIDTENWTVFAQGGYGFYGGGGKWGDIITGYASSWTQAVRESYTDVVFIGGYNDGIRRHNNSISVGELRTAMVDCITATKAAFPNATIHVAYCGRNADGQTVNGMNSAMSIYIESRRLGANYWNLENSLHDTRLQSSDGVHANTDGQTAIAAGMIDCMIGGKTQYWIYTYPQPSYRIWNNASMYIGEFLANDICTLYLPNDMTFTTAVSSWKCGQGTANAITLCELETYVIAGNSNVNTQFNTTCVMYADSKIYVCEALIIVRNNTISFDCRVLNDAGTDYRTFSNITRIVLTNSVFNVPSRFC